MGKLSQDLRGEGIANTYLYGGDAEAACLEENSDAARRHPFSQSTHHSPGH